MSNSLKPCLEFDIAGRTISADCAPYVVAEMSCSHQGQVEEAIALVDVAADAKADAIQFELFDTDDNIAPGFPNAELIRNLQLTPEEWAAVFQHSKQRNIATIAYVYDAVSFDLAKTLNPDAYKLNSSDLSNPDLLKALAQTGLPYTLGTGASDLAEIGESLEFALAHGGDQVVLMHGVQSFPTKLDDANVYKLNILREQFGTLVGYADHTNGADPLAQLVDLIALGAGAVIVEKHICTRRGDDRIDSQSALMPDEFAAYVERIRAMSGAMGVRQVQPFTDVEMRYRQFQKKTAVSKREIAEGQPLQREDFGYLRHESMGLSPMQVVKLIGTKASRAILPGEALQESDFS